MLYEPKRNYFIQLGQIEVIKCKDQGLLLNIVLKNHQNKSAYQLYIDYSRYLIYNDYVKKLRMSFNIYCVLSLFLHLNSLIPLV